MQESEDKILNIKEFYQKIGTNHNDVCRRLISEELVIKYLKQFLNDNSFSMLDNSIKEHDYDRAVHASHTLKGLCVTLGFGNISQQIIALHSNLQKGIYTHNEEDFSKIKVGYNQLIEWIKLLD